MPIVEHTALFKRSIGEYTDIVQKEMFTFEDPGGDSLTLRPEATAGIVRAMITQRPAAQPEAARVVRGPDVPAREAAARPLPAVLSARRRSVRLCRARHRCRADSAERASADSASASSAWS